MVQNSPTSSPATSGVYRLEDLENREILDAGHQLPAKLAVIGQPVAHSASPELHQAALDHAGIEARYVRIEVPPGKVGVAFLRMRALGFIGCNVTVPHKFEALEACDEIHNGARALGAVNTIRFDADGTRGFNTDGPGFVRAIIDAFDQSLGTFRVLIIGAGGGAGQAIAAQCAIQGVENLVLANRSTEKLARMMNRLRILGSTVPIQTIGLGDSELEEAMAESTLVVNASSVGLRAEDHVLMKREWFTSQHCVYDTIYQPAETGLLALARASGCEAVNGSSLLLHQGVLAFQHWFPHIDPIAQMREAMERCRIGKAEAEDESVMV